MDEICRLCCSTKFVNNHLFDEENALYLKMSLFLPIKVVRSDRLPQRVCDRCSCRVNDLYQFCNETIEVQHRLRAILQSSGLPVDDMGLSLLKDTPPLCERGTQTESLPPPPPQLPSPPPLIPRPPSVKQEPEVQVKTEIDDFETYEDACNVPSDNSDDMSLINLKKKKKKVKQEFTNGTEKRGRKRKKELKEWNLLLSGMPLEGAQLLGAALPLVKQEGEAEGEAVVKQEPADDKHDCCVCGAVCCSRGEMLQHYRQHGGAAELPAPAPPPPPAARPLRCPRCSKVLEQEAWAAHWLRHWERDRRPYRCARCEKTFRDHHQILKHGLTHKNEAEAAAPGKRFVCDLCPEGFVYMRYLLAHRTRAHPEAAARALALRCATCAREFAHLNSLRRHLRAHSGERNFLCSVCGKALSSREHLKFHLRIHAGYKPNVCGTCGKVCMLVGGGTSLLALRCATCAREFAHLNSLRRHLRAHSGERNFLCSVCGKALSSREHLKFHLRIHAGYKPNVCGTCGKVCMLVGGGTSLLALRCATCAREFAHLNSLRRHLRAHSGERNFLCSVCGKALSSREHLKFHLRIHAGYKPNVCGTCGKGFVKKCNLTLHERVHSGEKPHVCSHCGKAFSQRSTLVIHERYHSGARPYVCALCGRGFVAKGLLSMHLKTTCI